MKNLLMNQKISKKLFFAFALVTLFAVINGLFGIYFIYTTTDNMKELYNVDTQAQIDLAAAQSKFFDIEVTLKKIVINTNQTKSSYFTSIKDNFEFIYNFIEKYEADATNRKDAQELQYIQELKASCKDYEEIVNSIMNTAEVVTSNTIILPMVDTSDNYCELTETAFNNLSNYNAANSMDKVKNDTLSSNIAMGVMAGIILISALLAQILSRSISNLIARPLTVFAKFVQMLAVGDVHIELSEEDKKLHLRKDEIGILAGSFDKVITSTIKQGEEAKTIADGDLTTWITVRSDNDIVGNGLKDISTKLRSLVKSITEATNQVALNASSVSDSSMALSQGATEQASSIEELTASIEEIANQTEINTKNAQNANELAKHVKVGAERGNVHMEELQKAMEDINASSNSIKKIIKVIDDIAFQTNILALNAAVEAARAGQHGKGFAVVAEEVRTLAARSAQAAKETTELIEGSIKKVEAGAGITNGTTAAFKRMSNDVGQVADLLDGIAVAASEQASAIEQINQGITQVSQVVQNNAAISQESAAASIELTAQAQKLKDLLQIFKIKRESNVEAVKTKALKAEAKPIAESSAAKVTEQKTEQKTEQNVVKEAPKSKPKIMLSDADFGKY